MNVRAHQRRDQETLAPLAGLAAFAAALALMALLSPVAATLGPWGIGVLQVAAVAAPAVAIAAARSRAPLSALGVRMPRARALAGAALIGLSFWYLNLALVVPLNEALIGDDASVRRIAEILAVPELPLWAKLAILAALPALCEELLFRGAIARSLRPVAGLAGAVAIQAALFSLFHLSPARLLPTLCFGIVLGAVALFAASTAASALTHALNNAMAIVLVSDAGAPALRAIDGHPPASLGAAALMTALGLVLVVSARDDGARLWGAARGSRDRGGGSKEPE